MKCLLWGCHREQLFIYTLSGVVYRSNPKENIWEIQLNCTVTQKQTIHNSQTFWIKQESNMVRINRIWFHYGRTHHAQIAYYAHTCDWTGLVFLFPLCVCDINSFRTEEKKIGTQSLITVLISVTAFPLPHEITEISIHLFGKIHTHTDMGYFFVFFSLSLIPCAGFFLFSIASCDNRFVYIIKSVWIKCSSHSAFNWDGIVQLKRCAAHNRHNE